MHRLGPQLIWLFSLFAMLGALSCADDSQSEAHCVYDSDCGGDGYCLAHSCAAACSSDAQCPTGTFCEAYQRVDDGSPVQACLDEDASTNGAVECSSNQECRDALDDPTARCGIHDRCVLTPQDDEPINGEANNSEPTPANNQAPNNTRGNNQNDPEEASPTYLHLQLGDDEVPEPDQPLHLSAILVRNVELSALGIGHLLATHPTDDSADPVLSSAPVPVDDSGQCLENPHSQPLTLLDQPGSSAVVELVTAGGLPLSLPSEFVIDIFAAHSSCPLGSDVNPLPDDYVSPPYRLLLCDHDDPQNIEDGCSQPIDASVSGFSRIEVANPSDSG